MKKLILSTAIAAITASSVASAANIYEKDELTIKLNGDFQVQLFDPVGEADDLDVDYDDLQLTLGADYKLGKGMAAFGQLGLDWKGQADADEDDDDAVIDTAFVGLKVGSVTGSIGRQYFASDDFGVEKAIELDGGNAFPTTEGNESIKLGFGRGNVDAVLSYDIEDDNDEEVTELGVTTSVGKVELGAVYQNYKETPNSGTDETFAVMASMDIGRSNVGVDYSTNDDSQYTNIAVGFPLSPKTVAAVGMTFEAPDGPDNDVEHWYINATHKLHNNVSVFAEIGDNDADEDLGALTGLQVKF